MESTNNRFVRSWAVQALVDALAALTDPGAHFTYKQAERLVPGFRREQLIRAKNVCRKEHQQNWQCIRGVGYRLADTPASIAEVAGARLSLHRRAKKNLQTLANAVGNANTPEEQMRIAAEGTRNALLLEITTPRATRKLEAAVVASGNNRLPPRTGFDVVK